jgi:uracil-DNA glycosylase family 4
MEPFGNFKKGILNIGEAPGCVSGNTLIETAFRNKTLYPNGIPIRDLVGQSNFYVYSYDVESEKLVIGKVKRVWCSGRKETYRVTYEWFAARKKGKPRRRFTNSIVVSANHPFLLRRGIKQDPFKGLGASSRFLSIQQGLTVGHSIQPFLSMFFAGRRFIGSAGRGKIKESIFLTEFKIGRKIKPNHQENCHHKDENTLNDEWNNLECLSVIEHSRCHTSKKNPMNNPNAKKRHLEAVRSKKYRANMSKIMKEHLANPENYIRRLQLIDSQREKTSQTVKQKFATNPDYYYKYLLGMAKVYGWTDQKVERKFHSRFPNQIYFPFTDNHKIVSIEYVGKEEVYDMEVERYHNFAAQGIFVHNSSEDIQGKPWQGKAGHLLQRAYEELGIDLFGDCLNINACSCRPTDKRGNNRAPTNHEIACCRPRVWKVIEERKPKVVIALGNVAVVSLLGGRWKKNLGGITKWRGWSTPDRDMKAWFCPTFHPSYVERLNTDEATLIWKQDLTHAFSLTEKSLPRVGNDEEYVHIIDSPDDLPDFPNTVAFDYETTGVKPHAKGHKIVCASVAYDENTVYSFIMPESPVRQKRFLRMLRDSRIQKIAHNMKFEDTWSVVQLHQHVQGWYWDTMLAAHILDNRSGVTSLKFQTYVTQGVVDYDSEISPYLQGKGVKSANLHNSVLELLKYPDGKKELLMYCGLDSLYTYRLFQQQRKEMKVEHSS